MKIRSTPFRITLAALALLVGVSAAAHAQTVINSLPYVISEGGQYVLNSNLVMSQTTGTGIQINASNVTIDFQDHYMSGPSSGNTPVYGIYAKERANIVIKNGTISHFNYGVNLDSNGDNTTTNAVDARVENMRIAHCSAVGVALYHQPSARILDCQISQIGLSNSTGSNAGIYVVGPQVTIQGNTVSDITAGPGLGHWCILADNGVFIRQNQLSNGSDAVRLGIYQDNLCYQCTNLFTGGIDAGGNYSQN